MNDEHKYSAWLSIGIEPTLPESNKHSWRLVFEGIAPDIEEIKYFGISAFAHKGIWQCIKCDAFIMGRYQEHGCYDIWFYRESFEAPILEVCSKTIPLCYSDN